jgi:hypothetical protein
LRADTLATSKRAANILGIEYGIASMGEMVRERLLVALSERVAAARSREISFLSRVSLRRRFGARIDRSTLKNLLC